MKTLFLTILTVTLFYGGFYPSVVDFYHRNVMEQLDPSYPKLA